MLRETEAKTITIPAHTFLENTALFITIISGVEKKCTPNIHHT
jgi:hypothetical protein